MSTSDYALAIWVKKQNELIEQQLREQRRTNELLGRLVELSERVSPPA